MSENLYQWAVEELNTKRDFVYQQFNQKLIFTKYEIIGVRLPLLRKMAKQIVRVNPYSFLDKVTYSTHEEMLLMALVICGLKEEKCAYPYFKQYIEHIDSWAACDTLCSNYHIIKAYLPLYWKRILRMLKNKNPYIVRVGIVLLLDYYLIDEYIDLVLNVLVQVCSSHYYVQMALAWTYCEVLIRYPEKGKEIFKKREVDSTVEKMTIRKMLDSNRVAQKTKEKIRKTNSLV